MFDALSRLYEGKNINQKMTLRTQLKNENEKMQDSKSIQSYFTRVSQIREQIEAIGDSVEEAELVMTTMNGLPRPWDPFIKGIYTQRKLTKFSGLWEDCMQEEARLEAHEEKLGQEENQALTVQARKGKNKVEDRPPKKFQKHQKKRQKINPNIRCFTCQKVGHISRDCPLVRELKKNERNKRHHANGVEDEGPSQKKERNDNSDNEYSLISALTSTVTRGNDTWLVDSGASKHMSGFKDYLSTLIERESHQKVKLGDDYQYPIKGVGEASYKLESGKLLKMEDVLYVPGLKKKLLSISGLEKEGFRVAFVDG